MIEVLTVWCLFIVVWNSSCWDEISAWRAEERLCMARRNWGSRRFAHICKELQGTGDHNWMIWIKIACIQRTENIAFVTFVFQCFSIFVLCWERLEKPSSFLFQHLRLSFSRPTKLGLFYGHECLIIVFPF